MNAASAAGLSIAMLVVVASPGPGVLATVARAIASGLKPALAVIFGIVLGDLIYLSVAFYGLAAVARFLDDAFPVIKLCGVAYLMWMGVRMWRKTPQVEVPDGTPVGAPKLGYFASGTAVTLSNPTGVAFYWGFLPTFLDLSQPRPADFALAAGIVATVLVLVLSAYAVLASRARALFTSCRAVRRLHRAAGTVMFAAAFIIATQF